LSQYFEQQDLPAALSDAGARLIAKRQERIMFFTRLVMLYSANLGAPTFEQPPKRAITPSLIPDQGLAPRGGLADWLRTVYRTDSYGEVIAF